VGLLLCLTSAAGFGTLAIFATLAYDEGANATTLLAVRFLIAAVAFWALVAASGQLREVRELPRRLVLGGLALGGVGYTAQSLLYFAAVERAEPAPVALLLYTYPALVTLGAAALGRDVLTAVRVGALAVASAGTVLVLLGAGAGTIGVAGVLMALGSAVTYTGYILVADGPLAALAPRQLSALVCTGATLAFWVGGSALGAVHLGRAGTGLWWIALCGVVSVVAIGCFFAGLRRVGPSAASIMSTAEPVTTVVLGALVLGDGLAALQLAGGALVLAAVVALQCRPRARPGDARARMVDAVGA
jgi:drug/metabolite transporter (DMT)-like permease